MQQPQKRIILMPEICHQYLSVSKGCTCCRTNPTAKSSIGMQNDSSKTNLPQLFFPGFPEAVVSDSVAFMKMSPYQMILTATAAANSSTVTVIAI